MTKKQLNAISRRNKEMKVESNQMLEWFSKCMNTESIRYDPQLYYELVNNGYIYFKSRFDKKMYVKDKIDLFILLKQCCKNLQIMYCGNLKSSVESLINSIFKFCKENTYYSSIETIHDLLESEVK